MEKMCASVDNLLCVHVFPGRWVIYAVLFNDNDNDNDSDNDNDNDNDNEYSLLNIRVNNQLINNKGK